MASLARRHERSTNIWPGFVDALATLLMVIIFLLLIFIMAQVFLGQALTGRDQALRKLEGEISELASLLALERKTTDSLRADVSRLSSELEVSVGERERLSASVAGLRMRAESAEQQLVDAMVSMEASRQTIGRLETSLADTKKTLAVREEELADRVQRLNNLAREIEALTALRDELTAKVMELGKQANEKGEALINERNISESARAQVALMNRQLAALREQLATLEATLRAAEEKAQSQGVQIESLGKRLNAALASKVQELSRYRSEFFGRLREVLGNRPGIRIVGDRFVFQSEVLFDVASAELGPAGKEQMGALAQTLKELVVKIPEDIDWVLRVDGHTDKTPISTARFPSNWELSAARAISVVKYLIDQGLPPVRLVAAGFAANRPIDPGVDEIALRRNRRIELKLTQR
ncbi:MAG TPA: peptidoglycan -binding protein [Rhodospirillaceae bacterium]|nr:peptidoglycan -binding protein [Rhodospirillaceae bacterium]|tara:strand:+ start:909 stop:2144 length:1236 start_codon:yes stop_codon:yes gene_type:complete